MKYTAKFEEMIDIRKNAIDNMKKVIFEQNELLAYLSKEPEAKEKFKLIIDGLNNSIKENQQKIIEFSEANANTLFLIQKLKKADNETLAFIEQVIKEIGVFENQPQEPQPQNKVEEKPQPKEEKKDK